MKRRLTAKILPPLALLIIGNLLVAALLIRLTPDRFLIDLRFALFSKKAPTNFKTKFFHSNDLAYSGFRYPIKKYYTGKLNDILRPSFAGSKSTLDSARQIALALSTQPTKGHGNDQSDDLLNCVSLVAKGFGKCSDYAQCFAATCLENNIMVREVSNMTHTFNEIYLPSLKKWVFVDAQYCLTAHDNAGNLLSALDIFNAYANHTPLRFSSFAPYHKFRSEYQSGNGFYHVNGNSDAYKFLVVTNGINVFQVNKWNQQLNMIPKPARQFVLLSLGIQPGYIVYDPNNQIRPSLMLYRFAFVFAIMLVFLINLAAFRLWSRTANRKSMEDVRTHFIPQPSFARA